MLRFCCLLAGLFPLAFAGCGSEPIARVKGQVVENGQPKTFPATSHSVEIAPITGPGEVDKTKSFTAVVNPDGTFEVLASGGALPVGAYMFTVRGPTMNKKGSVVPAGARRELKNGPNDITLDIAKPTE